MEKQFNRIEGISDRRRLPRLGKIRLGIKAVSQRTGKEYPVDVDYFVCPDEVKKIYGEQPKELDVLVPVEDPEIFFPQALKAYASNHRLKCKGNNVEAVRHDEETNRWVERKCPCEWLDPPKGQKKKCGIKGMLMVILPKVNPGGVYQIDTGSYNSIVDINSSVDYIKALVGKIALVPLKLIRQPRETFFEGKKMIKHTLTLRTPPDWETIHKLLGNSRFTEFLLPEPIEEGHEPTGEGVVIDADTGEVIGEADQGEGEAKGAKVEKTPPQKEKEKETFINKDEKAALVKRLGAVGFDNKKAIVSFFKEHISNWKDGDKITPKQHTALQMAIDIVEKQNKPPPAE